MINTLLKNQNAFSVNQSDASQENASKSSDAQTSSVPFRIPTAENIPKGFLDNFKL